MEKLADIIPVKLSTDLKYSKSVVEHLFRIETDKFEICTPKVIRRKKYGIFDQVFCVHLKSDEEFSWIELK
jgi:hypothetical protein